MNDMTFVLATTLVARLRGLLGTQANWGRGKHVLALVPCKSVHTIGMAYELDIAFANAQGVVLQSRREVRPGCFASCTNATFVLERPSSSDPWLIPGDKLPLSVRLG